jgi:hypothetical protein
VGCLGSDMMLAICLSEGVVAALDVVLVCNLYIREKSRMYRLTRESYTVHVYMFISKSADKSEGMLRYIWHHFLLSSVTLLLKLINK